MRNIIFLLIFIFAMGVGSVAGTVASVDKAVSPLDTVKGTVEQVLSVVREGKDKPGRERWERLRRISSDFFDFDVVGRLALGRARKRFSKDQWEKFRDLFRDLLQDTYIKRIQDYSDEKIVYDRERMLSRTKAQVDTRVVTGSKEIPITYRLVLRDGEWKGYDVLVEGVSLLKNYRSQFRRILRKKSPDELIEDLRAKVDELRKDEPAA